MPNWISSKITINNLDDFNKVCDFVGEELDFNKIIPMPDYIYQGNLGRNEEDLYGKDNCWYDWSINNWGTKWNASDTYIDPSDNSIYFQTAWDGVPKMVGLLSQKFNTKIDYTFADEFLWNNSGNFVFDSGHVQRVEYHDNDYTGYKNYLVCWGYDTEDFGYKLYVTRDGQFRLVQPAVMRLY